MKAPKTDVVQLSDIERAQKRISDSLYCTPCIEFFSPFFSKPSPKLYLKLETMHQTGCFKERGALNKLLSIDEKNLGKRVIGASAGNHAQSVSYHGARLGFEVSMIMPESTPNNKIFATEKWGAHTRLQGHTVDEGIVLAKEQAKKEGWEFVHAFDDPEVIAGQGTLGLEILMQVPDVELVVVPIGGGGFISGTAVAIKHLKPSCKIIGVQSEKFPSMYHKFTHTPAPPRSLESSIADGIAVKGLGSYTQPLIEKYVDDIVLVSDEEIAQSILQLLEARKILAEGAGAAGLAAILHGKIPQADSKVTVTPICGGNIDMNLLSRIIERGYMRQKKLIRLNVVISDRPGSLHKLTGVLAELGANVLQIHHQRASTEIPFYNTGTDITLETRGEKHSQQILERLEKETYKVTIKN
ncbi:MAG: threonine ammonia-lyase [Bdellovibrionales bacterium]|nr:threonine ammonia-lyase [Bdellovibrionales bacterium]